MSKHWGTPLFKCWGYTEAPAKKSEKVVSEVQGKPREGGWYPRSQLKKMYQRGGSQPLCKMLMVDRTSKMKTGDH